jgi:anti-sigma regulatory factor (Ser/Thr protein kinase)
MVGTARHSARRFPAATASIRAARTFVDDEVTTAVAEWARLGDLLLVTSELVTNAIEHGGAGDVGVVVDVAEDIVVLTVTSALTDTIDDPAMWVGPTAAGPSGRGLMIVRSVVDEVEVSDGDGRLAIRCVFAR